jgi:hypothetical protein
MASEMTAASASSPESPSSGREGAAETGHRGAGQLVLGRLRDHQRQTAQLDPRAGLQGEEYRHCGACFRLEQIDERVRRLHRIHHRRDDVTPGRCIELLLVRHGLIARHERSVAA